MTKKPFSKYQLAIFDAIKNTDQHICVSATAGAGKTTTLLEVLNLVPKFKKTVFLSFSNAIVNELKEKVPMHTTASTLHSLGCKMLFRHYKKLKIDNDKWFKIFLYAHQQDERSDKKILKKCYEMADVVNFARMTLTPFTEEELTLMCNYYSLEFSKDHFDMIIAEFERKRPVTVIDFTDMIYLPVKKQLIDLQYDFVLLDEAQDLNNCQRLFIEKILKRDGRLVAVGDEKQSIYSFSGSSIDSFEILQKRANTLTLPLSISYRCPKNVVRKAQEVYPEAIQYYEHAEDGEVREGSLDEAREGDLVICRKTAPLIIAFFRLLAKGIKAKVIGKDIESGLLNVAEKIQSESMAGVQYKIEQVLNELEQELIANGVKKVEKHPKYVALEERIEVIKVILKNIPEPKMLISTIKEIFDDKKVGIKLMTIHRSKGLECNKVFVIEKYNGEILCPSPKATKSWEKVQENNLLFVAYTRAKKSLIQIQVSDATEQIEGYDPLMESER